MRIVPTYCHVAYSLLRTVESFVILWNVQRFKTLAQQCKCRILSCIIYKMYNITRRPRETNRTYLNPPLSIFFIFISQTSRLSKVKTKQTC